jgi:hypothetical protein
MKDENQEILGAIKALTEETRRLRRTVLIGFSVVCFIIGLGVFSYGNYVVMAVCFAVAAMFFLWEPVARGLMGKAMKKSGTQIGEEVRKHHAPTLIVARDQEGTRPA